eukprot:CAMPEP_0116554690 /NCGR_PEP_ID=MMETSP0397-20121206/7731_1 /TAXON_ID=216820 /ORGANISM="Cyclophora tenuis, Strain ECT3854" /LENGTH=400 /DNA_ID=CAMNT_0004079877 /DNA_START=10 /DNA_END=1213 /DNA_ORIENTATION=+
MEHHQTDGNRRARSLSRGRKLSGLWPPQAKSPAEVGSPERKTNDREQSRLEVTPPNTPPSQPADGGIEPASNRSIPDPPKAVARAAFNQQSVGRTLSTKENPFNKRQPADEPPSEIHTSPPEIHRVPSIKDRINAFTGNKSPSNKSFPNPKIYPPQYSKRDFPPQINMYEESRKQEDLNPSQDDVDPCLAPQPSTVPPSPAAVAAADAAAELVRRQQTQPTRKFGRSKTSTTTEGYLGAATRGSLHSAPLAEIAAADESGGVLDLNSVAMSSVSGDDYGGGPGSPTKRESQPAYTSKRPAWAERGTSYLNLSSSARGLRKLNATPSTGSNLSADAIEKLVEERVQARVAEVESRFEAQMLRLENRLEQKVNARIGGLETKIDKIEMMISELIRSSRQAEI